MCGIAGIVSTNPQQRITRDLLRVMAARIAHRGPDGEGVWLNHEDEPSEGRPQVGFAFRRLAVLDCDERAMQPMSTPDGRCTLVFNGEIYNFRELREQLPDVQWRTTGDTEVLLHALATWGEAALEKLVGMFAIAFWDGNRLLLARDRMGQKPLYITGDKDTIVFASELGSLRQWPGFDSTIGADHLLAYLRYGYVGDSIHQHVSQLAPGHMFDGVQRRPFWRPRWRASIERPYSNDDAVARTRALVESAVRLQLVSDVPLGVFLSGGVDSSVIALAARRAGPVKTFAIAFADPRYDESAYAREVADHLDTEHHEFHVDINAAEILPALARTFGEPFGDSSALPTYCLAQQARQHVTVALSGDGGDELFGGYDRYVAMHAGRHGRLLAPLAPLGRRMERGHPKARLTRIGRFLAASGLSHEARYRRYVALFDDELLPALRAREIARPQVTSFEGFLSALHSPMLAAMAWDRQQYLPMDLLTKVDRCSMRHALEVRSPFMDHALVEFAMGLTVDQLIGGGKKRLLRAAFAADLPEAVFKRPKMGFAVPIGEWFRSSLRSMLRDHLFAQGSFARAHFAMPVVEKLVEEHETQRRDHSQRLYALLMLELWQTHVLRQA